MAEDGAREVGAIVGPFHYVNWFENMFEVEVMK
jgi:hypothetical protein